MLAVNHLHWIDVPVIGAVCPRRIVFVAKAELLAVPVGGPSSEPFGTLSVRRGESDREAIRLAREAVRNGHAARHVRRGDAPAHGQPGEAKPGAAMVAIQEGRPVVPAAIYGSESWGSAAPRPGLARLGRADALRRASRGTRRATSEATAEIEAEIRRLWEFLRRHGRSSAGPDAVPPRARPFAPRRMTAASSGPSRSSAFRTSASRRS